MITSRERKPNSAASSHAPDQKLMISVRSRAAWSESRSQTARAVRRARAGLACALTSSWSVAVGGARSSSSSSSSGRSSLGVPSRWRSHPARISGCALMRPAGHGGAEGEQRVVQQHKLVVGGQAAVRLEAVEWRRNARASAASEESGP